MRGKVFRCAVCSNRCALPIGALNEDRVHRHSLPRLRPHGSLGAQPPRFPVLNSASALRAGMGLHVDAPPLLDELNASLLTHYRRPVAASQCRVSRPWTVSLEDNSSSISAIRLLSSTALNGFGRMGIPDRPLLCNASAYPVMSNILRLG